MTVKFLQALAKLKPSSPGEVRAEREKSESPRRGAVAFQADVYRRRHRVPMINTSRSRAIEH